MSAETEPQAPTTLEHEAPGRRRRIIVTAIAILALALAVDAIWAAITAAGGLRRAREELQAGVDDLEAGRIEAASASFEAAARASETAGTALRHPPFAIASILPWLGDDVHAARDLAEAARISAGAAREVVDAAKVIGWSESGFADPVGGVLVPVAELAAATPDLEVAAAALSQANALVDAIGLDGLFSPVRKAVEQARGSLRDGTSTLDSVTRLARLLPPLLGDDGARRYLIAFQNLSSPRGSGGFLGAYAILTADEGRLSLSEVTPARAFPRVPPIQPPDADYAERYAVFGGLTHLKAANYSPDFPTAARVVLDIWSAGGGEPLDGVIAVDPIWMSYVLAGGEPVLVSDEATPIGPDNVVEVLSHDVFLLPGQDASDRAQAAVASALWDAALGRVSDPKAFASAIARAARERHLQVYATDAAEEAMIDELGASGRLSIGSNPLFVTWQDAVDSRAGYFAERSVSHIVRLEADGSAAATTAVTLTNPAPDSPPSILLGSGQTGDPVGFFRTFTSVYLPSGADQIRGRAPRRALRFTQHEFERSVWMVELQAASQGSSTASISYRWPDAVRADEGASTFDIVYTPQPALRPEFVMIDVTLPAGVTIDSVRGFEVIGDALHYEGSSVESLTLSVTYSGPPGP